MRETDGPERSPKDEPIRVLMIGTMPNPRDPVGGAAILLEQLARGLDHHPEIVATVIDTSGGGAGLVSNIRRNFHAVARMVGEIRRSDVVTLHITTHRLSQFGPLVSALCRLYSKPYIVRKFGGTDYRAQGALRRILSTWVARGSSAFLVETRALVEIALADGIPQASWYPNSRPMMHHHPEDGRPDALARNFVFISQVRPSKGIPELIAAAERLGDEIKVDVYGPLIDGSRESMFAGCERIHYCGPLSSSDVLPTLERYDALVLPTYHPGEGYPGIIFEAYSVGLPVITTRWRAIPEITDDSSGILIEPRDAEALYQAMRRLSEDPALCARLRSGVNEKQSLFDSDAWCARFVELCQEVHRGRGDG
jgi:glycosyltransferase involved in cell wall biosynthesis